MTQVRIKDEVALRLRKNQEKLGETYNDIVERLLDEHENNKKKEEEKK